MKRFLLIVAMGPLLLAGWSFVSGAIGYFRGTAHLMTVGYPGAEFGNLDPTYRLHWDTSGCMVTGLEVLTHAPNNLAVVALVRVLGPMRGSYRGPYPSREQAREALRQSETIVSAGLMGYSSMGGSGPWELGTDCAQLARMFPASEEEPAARCAMFEDATILIGYMDEAILIDRGTGRQYARYRHF